MLSGNLPHVALTTALAKVLNVEIKLPILEAILPRTPSPTPAVPHASLPINTSEHLNTSPYIFQHLLSGLEFS